MKKSYFNICLMFSFIVSGQFPNPMTETFESATNPLVTTNPTSWSLPTGTNGNQWGILDNGVGTTSSWGLITQTTQAGLANSGLKAAYCTTENIGAGNTSQDYLTTPIFTVPNGGAIKFFVRTQQAGDQGSELRVKICVGPTSANVGLPSSYTTTLTTFSEVNLPSGFIYEEKTVDLTAFSGSSVSIAFEWKTTQPTAAIAGDAVFLDDIRISSNACLPPSNLNILNVTPTTLTLNWSENGNSQAWEVYVAPCGSPAPLVTTGGILTASTTYHISNLIPSTCYDFYVRSICNFGTGFTAWVPFTSSTMTQPNGACGTDIYDNGGSTGNYQDNSNYVITICPNSIDDLMGVLFSQFNTETGVDVLTIYDGTSTSDPILGQYSGSTLPPTTFSTSQNGCITLQFQSNGSINYEGFKATIVCAQRESIKMEPFLDTNNDGVKNNGELEFPFLNFQISQNAGAPQTMQFGAFTNAIYDANSTNTYSINATVNPNYSTYFTYSGTGFANQQTASPPTVLPFPITQTQPYSDVAVNIVPILFPRPGFQFMVNLSVINNGFNTASGAVNFEKGAGVVSLTSNYPGVVITPQGLSYTFSGLAPLSQIVIQIVMTLDVLPNVSLGQLITHQATLTLNPMDVITANNTTSLSQIIVGAYDPNFVIERHGPQILYSTFGPNDTLEYTIHFQNEGNFYAENVRIDNLLDSQLNAGSIQLLEASHPCRLVRDGSQLKFYFDDIFLQPKSVSEAASQGYVTFKIKPNPGYQVGTIIPNSAEIYFDYNPPIYTNTFQTKFVNSLANTAFDSTDFVLYPNPTHDSITLNFSSQLEGASVEVYDYTGKRMYRNRIEGTPIHITLQDYAPGMYFVRVFNAQGSTVKKVVKW
ncbi:T9SS-dependent choice-of-anchor J family protein [Flavobacterium sp. N1719]|uniref:T9SS-dependent choice-of-anchor J family protein n=1 Tax=Flavobacterium sp. N1719 TaxID=2885633 RepID=UPI0022223E04|nr:choice-of-anchor J domain-containing protein [Flavobacterium sp. N1719]